MNHNSSAGNRPEYYSSRSHYQPTAEQLARDSERRHYLRRNVYMPVIVASVVVLILFVLIVLLAFGIALPPAKSFIAAMSSLVIILITLPLISLLSILPVAWLVYTIHRRRQRKDNPETGPMAYRSWIQIRFWQIDSMLGGAQHGVDELGVKARQPLVTIHSRVAWLKGFRRGIK